MEINIIKKDESFLKIVENLIDKSLPLMSNLANLSRLLIDCFTNTSWAGFYLSNDSFDTLFLGPYQGPLACSVISFNNGVCGKSAYLKKTIIVPDVHKFEGHIACSSLTNSEIVIPLIKNNKVYGVIDLDSTLLNNYNEDDAILLEKIALLITDLF